jgi:hypothetical protein
MNLESLVPTLALCQQLKAAGFPQDTALVWMRDNDSQQISVVERSRTEEILDLKGEVTVLCAAPTAEEILRELPETYDSDYYLSAVLRKGYAHVGWYDWDDEYLGHVDEGEGQSLVQAAVLAFLWWKEQK